MRSTASILAGLAVCVAVQAAAPTVYKETRDYRKEPRSYIMEKVDGYSRLVKEPVGTEVDWGFIAPDLDLEDLRRSTVTFWADSATGHGGVYYAYYWANPISISFEQAAMTQGLHLQRATGLAQSAPVDPRVAELRARVASAQADGMRRAYEQNPQLVEMMIDNKIQADRVGQQVELDRYNEDKGKLGVEEAAKRAEERKKAQRERIRAELLGTAAPAAAPTQPEPATAPPAAKPPEEREGYNLVLVVTEQNQNTGSAVVIGVGSNSTSAEILLFKNAKLVAAARHVSASVGFGGGSGAKCGKALASLFSYTPPKVAEAKK